MTYLLDVNVLIALVDPAHVAHEPAHAWFAAEGGSDWATSPTTENGLLRIVGNPNYPNSPGSPAAVVPILAGLRRHPGHQFWPDDICLLETSDIEPANILTSGQMTDTYLLGLAKVRKGKLATFDRRLSVAAVVGGAAALQVISISGA